MTYYFCVSGGLAVLVDSLYLSTDGLVIIRDLLAKNVKLQEDF